MKGEGLPLSPLQGGGGTPCPERSFGGATSSGARKFLKFGPQLSGEIYPKFPFFPIFGVPIFHSKPVFKGTC